MHKLHREGEESNSEHGVKSHAKILSVLSPGDDLLLESAIHLHSQTGRSNLLEAMRSSWKQVLFGSESNTCGLAAAIAMPLQIVYTPVCCAPVWEFKHETYT